MVNHQRVGIIKTYQLFWRRYFNFKLLSNRREFWWPFLFNWLIRLILLVGAWLESSWVIIGLLILYNLAALIPSISLTFRRYRDAGFSGWWILYTDLMFYVFKLISTSINLPLLDDLCNLLIFSCVIIGLILAMMPSEIDHNKYVTD